MSEDPIDANGLPLAQGRVSSYDFAMDIDAVLPVGHHRRLAYLQLLNERSRAGEQLTDEEKVLLRELNQMTVEDYLVAEAERGYAVERLRRGGRPRIGRDVAEPVTIRMPKELKAALEREAARQQTSASEIVREALLGYLPTAEA